MYSGNSQTGRAPPFCSMLTPVTSVDDHKTAWKTLRVNSGRKRCGGGGSWVKKGQGDNTRNL